MDIEKSNQDLRTRCIRFQIENKSISGNNEYLKRRVQELTNQKKALVSYINENCPTVNAETISKILNESAGTQKTGAYDITDEELKMMVCKKNKGLVLEVDPKKMQTLGLADGKKSAGNSQSNIGVPKIPAGKILTPKSNYSKLEFNDKAKSGRSSVLNSNTKTKPVPGPKEGSNKNLEKLKVESTRNVAGPNTPTGPTQSCTEFETPNYNSPEKNRSESQKTVGSQGGLGPSQFSLKTINLNNAMKHNNDLKNRLMKLSNVNMECEILTDQSMMDPGNQNLLTTDPEPKPPTHPPGQDHGSAHKEPPVHPRTDNKIADNFFVAGIEKNSFMNFLGKFKHSINIPDKIVLEPKVIFTYPENEELTNSELRTSLKLAFPNDVHINRVKVSDCMSEINEIIFYDANAISSKIFAFPLMNYKQIGIKKVGVDKNSVKELTNPNDYTYYVCLSMDEFFNIDSHANKVDGVNASKKEFTKKFYTTKLMICIVTRYPFISFFKDFLTFIANSIKIERAKRFSEMVCPNDLNVYSTIDSQFLIEFLENEVRPTLTKLLQVRCPGFKETILIDNMHQPIVFQIPSKENCFSLEALAGHDALFNA